MTGSSIGPYVIVTQLGEGRLGRLYLGRHTASGEEVCLRELDSRILVSEDARVGLIGIVRRLAAVDSDYVTRTIDLLEAGALWYLVSEFVHGVALRDLLDRSQQERLRGFTGDSDTAAALIDDVARGCLALHAAGIVHGAVGASTVFVDTGGRARLTDAALLSVAAGHVRAPEADARNVADLIRVLRRSWVTARQGADIDRAADRAEAGDLGTAIGALDRRRDADARARLRFAASAWIVTGDHDSHPAVEGRAKPHDAAVSGPERPTILDAPGVSAPPRGATVIEAAPLTGAASARASAPVGVGASSPPPRGTVVDRPPPSPSSATVIDSPPEDSGPTRYRLGASGAAPYPTPPPPHARQGSGGGGGGASSSLLVRSMSAAEPLWPPPRTVNRRGTSVPIAVGAILAIAVVVAAGVIAGVVARSGSGLQVTGAHVAVEPRAGCNATADVRGIVDLNGEAGTIDYSWQRNDGASTGGVLHQSVASGQRQLVLHLAWTLTGPGTLHAVATLTVQGPQSLPPASGSFVYSCPG